MTRITRFTNGDTDRLSTKQIATKPDQHLPTNRQAAAFVGVLCILATGSAMLGRLVFSPPMLTGPDYLSNGAAIRTRWSWEP